jgi:hypothetical protein
VGVLDELVGVAVTGHDDDVVPAGLGLLGERGDDVVCLVAGQVDGDDTERVDDLPHEAHLLAQDVGRLVPVGLVGGDALVAEGLLRAVEGGDDRVWLMVLHEVDQHGCEAEDGVGDLAPGGRHVGRQGEERPVGQRVAVQQEELGHGDDLAQGASSPSMTS